MVFEAVIEVAGIDTLVRISDDTCSADEGCPYSIGCPNLINEANLSVAQSSTFYGTDSNDLFILPDRETGVNVVHPYDGYDVVFGSEGDDTVNVQAFPGGSMTAFLNGGDDVVFPGPGKEKIYFGKGDDELYQTSNDGIQDLFYGGGGTNHAYGFDPPGNDILINF